MTTNGPAQSANGNGNGTAIVRSAKDKAQDIEKKLNERRSAWSAMLPAHIKPDVMLRSAMAAISKTPDLLQCTPQSVLLSMAQACSLGLPPNTPLGLSYLVPFKTTCTFVPGYRGLIRLAIQSGEVQDIFAQVVYSKDSYEIHFGSEPRIFHTPSFEADRGSVVGVYAVAILKSGRAKPEWMSIQQVNAIRDRSKAAKDGPWVTDWEEMAKKTVIRRLCKTLPLSEEKLQKALDIQGAAEAGTPDFGDVIDVMGEPSDPETGEVIEQPKARSESLRDRVIEKAG